LIQNAAEAKQIFSGLGNNRELMTDTNVYEFEQEPLSSARRFASELWVFCFDAPFVFGNYGVEMVGI